MNPGLVLEKRKVGRHTSRTSMHSHMPRLDTIQMVEEIISKAKEFSSKNQLLRKLDGSMKASVLNVILKYLKGLGKVIDNEDGSWTWIYAANNKKLKKSYEEAVNL